MATRNLSGRQPIKNIAKDPPERVWFTSDGEEIREKLNPMRSDMKKKMLDKTGGSYWLSLASGYAVQQNENMYGPQILREKIKKGHLPLDECPLAMHYVTAAKGDSPCGGVFEPEDPCPHILAIAKNRKENYAKRQADYIKHFKKHEEREVGDLVAALKQVVSEKPAVAPTQSKRGRRALTPDAEEESESADG